MRVVCVCMMYIHTYERALSTYPNMKDCQVKNLSSFKSCEIISIYKIMRNLKDDTGAWIHVLCLMSMPRKGARSVHCKWWAVCPLRGKEATGGMVQVFSIALSSSILFETCTIRMYSCLTYVRKKKKQQGPKMKAV